MPVPVGNLLTMKILTRCLWASLKNGSHDGARFGSQISKYSTKTSVSASNKLTHTPVLLHQVVEFLQPEKCKVILDATFGGGGHTRELLKHSKTVKILCLDRDPLAFSYSVELQKEYPNQIIPMLGKFSDLPALLKSHGHSQNSIDAVLFDFGSSSMQFDDADRGFALSKDGPLDMRMDGTDSNCITAADVLAYASEEDLYKIFKIYGEEVHARKIARGIMEARVSCRPLKRTSELRDLISVLFDKDHRVDKLGRYSHISTKTFQALRIFVNNELNEINHAMLLAYCYLKIGGVMVTVSFHSLEDTIVKHHITGAKTDETVNQQLSLNLYNCSITYDRTALEDLKKTKWKSLTKHVITPNRYEIDTNPRSRSAKLRACIKI